MEHEICKLVSTYGEPCILVPTPLQLPVRCNMGRQRWADSLRHDPSRDNIYHEGTGPEYELEIGQYRRDDCRCSPLRRPHSPNAVEQPILAYLDGGCPKHYRMHTYSHNDRVGVRTSKLHTASDRRIIPLFIVYGGRNNPRSTSRERRSGQELKRLANVIQVTNRNQRNVLLSTEGR